MAVRTEGDTWDIVSSVGRTALGVAAFRALETKSADPMIRDEFAEMFVQEAGDAHFIDLLANPPEPGKKFLMPGFWMGFRTRFFDEFFEKATHQGAPQAVIVAAGLDARTYRLDWPAGTTVFEIDQPKVLEFKRDVLERRGAVPKATRREVAVDLRDDWPAALVAAGFDASKPTAWSAEGLLAYLPGAAQDALFERIDALSAPGSRFAVECFNGGSDARRFAELRKKLMGKVGEQVFGDVDPSELFYDDQRTEAPDWFSAHGWSVDARNQHELGEQYGRPIRQEDIPEDFPKEFADMWRQRRYVTVEKGPAV